MSRIGPPIVSAVIGSLVPIMVTPACAPQVTPAGGAAATPTAAPPPPATQALALPLRVETEAGDPLPDTVVGVRGGFDFEARAVGQTNADGQIELPLDGAGFVLVTIGESARAIVSYGSSATKDTVALFVDGPLPAPLRLVHGPAGSAIDPSHGEIVEVWPVARSIARYETYLAEVLRTAKTEADPAALDELVDRQ